MNPDSGIKSFANPDLRSRRHNTDPGVKAYSNPDLGKEAYSDRELWKLYTIDPDQGLKAYMDPNLC